MISNKALERASKDGFVSENKGKYEREIASIAIDPLGRKKREKIGEFSVSPMGHSRKGFIKSNNKSSRSNANNEECTERKDDIRVVL